MDISNLFRSISKQLQADFELTAQVGHRGVKGDFREEILRKFLIQGKKLPERFGISTGEIITYADEVSHQCDLIIYDKIDGLSLITSESVNVFPVECVVGIIEVKSILTKGSLLDGLEKVKHLKSITPNSASTTRFGRFTIAHGREKPFGIIFSYDTKISLEKATEHYKSWARNVDKELLPNLIVILNSGVIKNVGRLFRQCLLNSELESVESIVSTNCKDDSLFHFYNSLLDLCSVFKAGSFNLTDYFANYKKSGDYIVTLSLIHI